MSLPLIAVIGPNRATQEELIDAEQIGRLIAKTGYGLVCGGLGGVMEAACRGCAEEGGMTVGLLPGKDDLSANPHVKVAIATGMDEMRNMLVVRSARAVIAISGGPGTLSEIAFALRIGKQVVGLGTFELTKDGIPVQGLTAADTPEQAVELAIGSST